MFTAPAARGLLFKMGPHQHKAESSVLQRSCYEYLKQPYHLASGCCLGVGAGGMGVGTEWLAGYGDWDGVGGRQ